MCRLDNLRSRLARVEADAAAWPGPAVLRRQEALAQASINLEANGYGSHAEWLADWRDARSGEFFVLGSRDETGGCQLCVAGIAGDGSLTLRLRLPDCLAGGTWQIRGHRRGEVRLLPWAGAGGPAGQAGVRGVQAPGTRRRGGPRDLSGTGNIVPLQAG